MSLTKKQIGETKALLTQVREAIAECNRLKKENEELRRRLNKEVKDSIQIKRRSASNE